MVAVHWAALLWLSPLDKPRDGHLSTPQARALLGDSLAVELAALTRAALVQIQVPQPQSLCFSVCYPVDNFTVKLL